MQTTKALPAAAFNIDPDHVEKDIARLVLGILELVRQILELRAIKRMEEGSLQPDKENDLGETLMRAEAVIIDVAAKFGLTPDDLSLDLGPLGRTI